MTKRKVSNLLALAILSLLRERPMHPYEISAVMKYRGISHSIKLNYGSLYSVIEMLLREGLIIPQGTQREGRHPERTIYTVTEAGSAELIDWLRTLIRTTAVEYPQFTAGLTFIGHLAPADAESLLEERLGHLKESHQKMRTLYQHTLNDVDPIYLLEDEYRIVMTEGEIAWVEKVIREIKDGTLTEIIDGTRCWKIRHHESSFQPIVKLSEQAEAKAITEAQK
ncbi:MAG TPA: PadR family transcriptional regulator [Ktedonobacteraceae bacterium]|nr:PadR family transcriptional regulator [Ktedonobacteraceae bacterium]